jgi:hypothetical protein
MTDAVPTSLNQARLRYADSDLGLDWRMTSREYLAFQRASGGIVTTLAKRSLLSIDVGDACVTHADWKALERLINNFGMRAQRGAKSAKKAPPSLIKAEAARRAAHKNAFRTELRAVIADQRRASRDEIRSKTKSTKKAVRS